MGGAQPQPDFEIIGLDRQCFLERQAITVAVGHREFLQDHRNRQLGLDQRKLSPDARTRTIAKRLVGMRMVRCFGVGQPAVDVELQRVIPCIGMALQSRRIDVDRPVLAHPPLAADDLVFKGSHGEGRRRRP